MDLESVLAILFLAMLVFGMLYYLMDGIGGVDTSQGRPSMEVDDWNDWEVDHVNGLCCVEFVVDPRYGRRVRIRNISRGWAKGVYILTVSMTLRNGKRHVSTEESPNPMGDARIETLMPNHAAYLAWDLENVRSAQVRMRWINGGYGVNAGATLESERVEDIDFTGGSTRGTYVSGFDGK